MKYLNQYDKYSCAPISVINALKWMGIEYDNIDLPSFQKILNTKTNGTSVNDINRGVKHLGISEECVIDPSLKRLNRELEKGNSAIITYWGVNVKGDNYGHATFCIGKVQDHYKVVNCIKSIPSPVQYIRVGMMKRFLRHINPQKDKSRVWFIRRIENG